MFVYQSPCCRAEIITTLLEYYSAIKKNKIIPFAVTWMKPETIILSEVNQKERQIPYDITYIWNLINSTNEPIYRKETDT